MTAIERTIGRIEEFQRAHTEEHRELKEQVRQIHAMVGDLMQFKASLVAESKASARNVATGISIFSVIVSLAVSFWRSLR